MTSRRFVYLPPTEEHISERDAALTLQLESRLWRLRERLEPTAAQQEQLADWQAGLVRAGVGMMVDEE